MIIKNTHKVYSIQPFVIFTCNSLDMILISLFGNASSVCECIQIHLKPTKGAQTNYL